jgi:hypothetical protein
MAGTQTHMLPTDKFLTLSVNLLHKVFLEATRTEAKNLYRELSEGKPVPLTRVRMEDGSEVRFEVALDHSEYRGRLNFGAFRAGVTLLVANIADALREEKPVRTFHAEHDPNVVIFEIAAGIARHQVVVIVPARPAPGKSTQLPKICLELGRGRIIGRIGHTQPRRIAARSLASRGSPRSWAPSLGRPGRLQGALPRPRAPGDRGQADDRRHPAGEMQHDRELNEYDTLIIDEAHERSLNIDFLLGYLKQLLPKRPDLKLIVTSATIDPQRFSRLFRRRPGGGGIRAHLPGGDPLPAAGTQHGPGPAAGAGRARARGA